MKTGLVLEGGAMRGLYTAGVLDVFMENQIRLDGAVGVSAGAVFGCNYKSGQIGRTLRYNKKYSRDKRYMSVSSLIRTGDLFGEQFCYHDIPERLDPFDQKAYQENPMDFYVVCTDVRTGAPVYHLCNQGDAHDLKWMQASASMPMVSRIVEVDGYALLDGGMSDSIPVAWMRGIGYEKNIVVLTRAAGYRKKAGKFDSILYAPLNKYPELKRVMLHRPAMYNAQLELVEQLANAGEILVIRPSAPITISRTERDPKKLQQVYDLGRADAMRMLAQVKSYICD